MRSASTATPAEAPTAPPWRPPARAASTWAPVRSSSGVRCVCAVNLLKSSDWERLGERRGSARAWVHVCIHPSIHPSILPITSRSVWSTASTDMAHLSSSLFCARFDAGLRAVIRCLCFTSTDPQAPPAPIYAHVCLTCVLAPLHAACCAHTCKHPAPAPTPAPLHVYIHIYFNYNIYVCGAHLPRRLTRLSAVCGTYWMDPSGALVPGCGQLPPETP